MNRKPEPFAIWQWLLVIAFLIVWSYVVFHYPGAFGTIVFAYRLKAVEQVKAMFSERFADVQNAR